MLYKIGNIRIEYDFFKDCNIAWYCNIKHAKVLPGSILSSQNMKSGNGYYQATMNTRLVSLIISCLGNVSSGEIRASVDCEK